MHPTTLRTEAFAAVLGLLTLLRGKPNGADYFDPSPRGVAGSFIALIVSGAIMIGFFSFASAQQQAGMGSLGTLLIDMLGYAAQIGIAYAAFGLFDRQNRFLAYLTADNWVTALFVIVLIAASVIAAFGGAMMLGPAAGNTITSMILVIWIVLIVCRLILAVNILRFVVGLTAGQLILVIVGQVVALVFSIGILGGVMGV